MELPRTQYSQEFREQSVKFFKESGLTLVEAAESPRVYRRLYFLRG